MRSPTIWAPSSVSSIGKRSWEIGRGFLPLSLLQATSPSNRKSREKVLILTGMLHKEEDNGKWRLNPSHPLVSTVSIGQQFAFSLLSLWKGQWGGGETFTSLQQAPLRSNLGLESRSEGLSVFPGRRPLDWHVSRANCFPMFCWALILHRLWIHFSSTAKRNLGLIQS